MGAKLVVLICGAAVASGTLAACGDVSTGATTVQVRRVSNASAVYQWGRVGGAKAILGVGPIRSAPTPVRGIGGTVTEVATSNSTGYALTAAGAVYAWGTGSQGELGNGSTTTLATRAVRVHFPAGVRIVSLANPMPYDGAIAIDANGNAWGWGNDKARNFCLPVGGEIDTPVKLPLSDLTLAAGAWRHSIYDAGGRVVSCGLSDHGQLGNGTIGPGVDTATPVAVKGLPPGRVVALTSAFGNAGALMADGAYYDWGINDAGQVGDGTTTDRTTAVRVELPAPVRSVFEGGSFPNNGQTIAILQDGQVWVWGANGSGQLGGGTTASATRPIRLVTANPGRFVAVSSGGATDYAIGRAGDLWAWGQGAEGEIGDGRLRRSSATPVATGVDVAQVSATARNAAALASVGRQSGMPQ